jgi:hypothetical protein
MSDCLKDLRFGLRLLAAPLMLTVALEWQR